MNSDTPKLTLHRPEPVPKVIALLEDLLNRAKEGEIIAIAVAAQCPHQRTMNAYDVGRGDRAYLVCAIELAKLTILSHFRAAPDKKGL